jgi:RNA recognition motif-containing protein
LYLQALQRVIEVAMAATANQNEAEEEDDDAANPFLDEPRALKVRNLSPVVTAEQVRQLFGFGGTVVECNITGADAAKEAYVEFEKPEEATAALQLKI